MKDNKKIVADVIKCICDRIELEYKNNSHDGFIESINDCEMAYLFKDKGIEKRIQKRLAEKLKLNSTVQYEFYPAGYGKIYIKLLENAHKYNQTIKMPRELLGRL